MPLFGPNIGKLKKKGDIGALIAELDNKDFSVRTKVVEALGELNHIEGIAQASRNENRMVRTAAIEILKKIDDEMAKKYAADALIGMLKYGGDEEKIEALTRIRGFGDYMFLVSATSEEWLASQLEKVKIGVPLNYVVDDLISIASQEDINPLVQWYSSVTLAELGERNSSNLTRIIDLSRRLINYYSREDLDSFWRTIISMSIKKETLRSISFFQGNPVATNAVVDAIEGRFWTGTSGGEPSLKFELYALGVLGDSSARERLEYWSIHGNKNTKGRAKAALDFFGEVSFDELQALAKSKYDVED